MPTLGDAQAKDLKSTLMETVQRVSKSEEKTLLRLLVDSYIKQCSQHKEVQFKLPDVLHSKLNVLWLLYEEAEADARMHPVYLAALDAFLGNAAKELFIEALETGIEQWNKNVLILFAEQCKCHDVHIYEEDFARVMRIRNSKLEWAFYHANTGMWFIPVGGVAGRILRPLTAAESHILDTGDQSVDMSINELLQLLHAGSRASESLNTRNNEAVKLQADGSIRWETVTRRLAANATLTEWEVGRYGDLSKLPRDPRSKLELDHMPSEAYRKRVGTDFDYLLSHRRFVDKAITFSDRLEKWSKKETVEEFNELRKFCKDHGDDALKSEIPLFSDESFQHLVGACNADLRQSAGDGPSPREICTDLMRKYHSYQKPKGRGKNPAIALLNALLHQLDLKIKRIESCAKDEGFVVAVTAANHRTASRTHTSSGKIDADRRSNSMLAEVILDHCEYFKQIPNLSSNLIAVGAFIRHYQLVVQWENEGEGDQEHELRLLQALQQAVLQA